MLTKFSATFDCHYGIVEKNLKEADVVYILEFGVGSMIRTLHLVIYITIGWWDVFDADDVVI